MWEIGCRDVKVSGETIGDFIFVAGNVLCEEGGVVMEHVAGKFSGYFIVEVVLYQVKS